ncbi:MAG: hypothetical protein SO108_01395 [Bacilli bacterium]|nr:hypothetical protein [Bacilli bacterium]
MNEENNKKRNKIIIIVAVLFLLTAGIITVYSFKNTKAEEIDGGVIGSLFGSPTVSCPTGFEMRKGASGCVMNANTLKKIPGFAMKVGSDFVSLNNIDVDSSLSFEQTKEIYDSFGDNNFTNPVYSNGEVFCEQLKCFKIKIVSASTATTHETVYFDETLGVYKSSDNYYIHVSPEVSGDDLYWFYGDFVYVFPDKWFESYKNETGFFIEKNSVKFIKGSEVTFGFNKPIANVTLNLNEENSTSNSISRYVILDTESDNPTSESTWYFKVGTPTKTGYIFDGWTTERDYTSIVGPDNDGYYTINFGRGITTNGRAAITLKAVWEKEDSSLPRLYSVYYKDSTGNNTVDTKTHSSSNFTIINGKNDYCVGTDANKMFSYWKNMTDTSDTNKYCLDTTSGCTESITIPNGKTSVTLKAVCSSNSGGGSTPKYTVTLKKNCSGTFVCSSTTNSEVCTQLKSNGRFTKTVTKGDTFAFPKTFDKLTCDGKEISSWGSFDLGYELNVTSDVTASAKWKSSSGGGDTPSNDEYAVTLKKNCSGTFVCSSSVNSEVCNQLKNNGKFTKSVTKGDTFIFPKTFDTLTCDGENIDKWGIYNLGSSITVNSNITASAKWKNSSSNDDPIDNPIDDPSDDPSDDPIDNPQTGSIVIYLVLLFGIGALAYSVWYFRGFRKN